MRTTHPYPRTHPHTPLHTHSDQMDNKGAFINIQGGDLTPKFVSFDAVVCIN